jgi:hypothetical protein
LSAAELYDMERIFFQNDLLARTIGKIDNKVSALAGVRSVRYSAAA